MGYRGNVKNGDNNRKGCDHVEHIFGESFEHDPPPVLLQSSVDVRFAILVWRAAAATSTGAPLIQRREAARGHAKKLIGSSVSWKLFPQW
jgi:hypothetical protein